MNRSNRVSISVLLSMPLKKNTKTRTSATAKSKRTSVFKDDKVGPRTAPMVTALKENNRCLASALGMYICWGRK